jgi:ABC-2 type transport system permease protein
LDDLFFKYGFRIQPNLVLDLECTSIPLIVGKVGSKNQFDLKPWFYHILAGAATDHPIVKGLDRVNLRFPASIDTIKTKNFIEKTPLLSSSVYTRTQFAPVILDFEMAKGPVDPEKFNKSPQTVALLLEGSFSSLYKNRVPSGMLETLDQIDVPFKELGAEAKILVVADGDVIKNLINPSTGEFRELGYNRYTRYTYDNKNFLVNAIEYMLDSKGLYEIRAKEVKLRLLDKPRIRKDKTKWQFFNIGLPLLLLILFGLGFNGLRKYKFART